MSGQCHATPGHGDRLIQERVGHRSIINGGHRAPVHGPEHVGPAADLPPLPVPAFLKAPQAMM